VVLFVGKLLLVSNLVKVEEPESDHGSSPETWSAIFEFSDSLLAFLILFCFSDLNSFSFFDLSAESLSHELEL
jgi:hypothetical protein